MSPSVRRGNLAALVRALHLEGPRTRSELAAATGLNRSTIAALASELAAAGLVRERRGTARAASGRPSHVVELNADRLWALAVELAPDAILAARVGLGGSVRARADARPAGGEQTPEVAVAAIARLSAQLVADAPAGAELAGVAVAVPGIVRRADGLVRLAPNLGWREAAFGEALARALRQRVEIANEADLGVLAEHARGAAAASASAVYISGNTGVGAGILAGGRPLSGTAGYAGEVGHMKVNPGGHRCRCGARGCWETEVGAPALLRRAGRRPRDVRAGVARLLADAAAGEPRALASVQETARWMGHGVANLVNVLNPELVLFGGLMREVYLAAAATVLAELRRQALPQAAAELTVREAGLDADSVLLGAAELALAPVLSDPLGWRRA